MQKRIEKIDEIIEDISSGIIKVKNPNIIIEFLFNLQEKILLNESLPKIKKNPDFPKNVKSKDIIYIDDQDNIFEIQGIKRKDGQYYLGNKNKFISVQHLDLLWDEYHNKTTIDQKDIHEYLKGLNDYIRNVKGFINFNIKLITNE